MQQNGNDDELEAAEGTGEETKAVKEKKKSHQKEGFETESIKTKGNIRSTVMGLPTTPQKVNVPDPKPTETKQYAGTYIKRKILPGYKSVASESSKEAFVKQKRKGRLRGFENVDVKAKKKG